MEQTLREKLRANRRRKRLRLLRLLVYFGIIIGLIVAGWRYVHQPGFAFGSTDIRGTNRLTEKDIIEMAGSQPPFNLFTVSADKVRTALEHDTRFQAADVRYMWPGVLRVIVKEREAAIYVANSYQSYLKVDYSGMVLDVTAAIPDANAPMLVGEDCGNVYIGETITNPRVLNILRFLDKIGHDTNDQIVEIVVDAAHQVRVQLRGGYPVLLGSADTITEKADVFCTVFNEIKDKKIQAEYIDLSFAKPYIRLNGNENEVILKK